MSSQYPFAQLAVFNQEHHSELRRQADKPPQWSHRIRNFRVLLALKWADPRRTPTFPLVGWLALLVLLSGCQPIHPVTAAKPASTTVLYQTGFEPPDFAPGTFDGQQGWIQRNGRPDGATIVTLTPATGVQALRNEGALMLPVPTRPWSGVLTFYPLDYNVVEHHTPVLVIEADVRLDGPNSGKGPGANANLVAVGRTPYGVAALAFNALASDAAVHNVTGASAPAALGQYQHLGVRLDFTQQTAEYFLNGVSFGIEPFRDTKTAVGLFGVRLDLVGDAAVAAQYTASYDNLVVKAEIP